MDWLSSGRIDSFRFVRVSWDTGEEQQELRGILGGSLDRNSSTLLKASGSLDYIDEPSLGRDLVRVYSDSAHPLTGERETVAHGTFLVATPSCTFRGEIAEGTADLYSVLQVLAESAFDGPYVARAGTLAVETAAAIVRDAGLNAVASVSAARLNADAVFDEEKASKLDVVNWLMDFAGFDGASVDGYGNVILRPRQAPATLEPAVIMSDEDGRCVYRSGVVREFDTFDVPNVVVVTKSNAGGSAMTATAVNDDPGSMFSTVTRGRRIVRSESVSDIESQAALQAKAQAVLTEATSAVEGFEIEHAYLPMDMGDRCDFTYRRAGVHRDDLIAVRQTMKLRPGMPCTTRFHRLARR